MRLKPPVAIIAQTLGSNISEAPAQPCKIRSGAGRAGYPVAWPLEWEIRDDGAECQVECCVLGRVRAPWGAVPPFPTQASVSFFFPPEWGWASRCADPSSQTQSPIHSLRTRRWPDVRPSPRRPGVRFAFAGVWKRGIQGERGWGTSRACGPEVRGLHRLGFTAHEAPREPWLSGQKERTRENHDNRAFPGQRLG